MKSFKLFFVLFLLSFLVVPISNIKAVSLNPASGTYAPGSQVTLTVTAAPTGPNSNAVAIRLALTNATVVSFTPVTGGSWVGQTQDCAGPSYYTTNTVCASLAKSIPIVAGETLGTLIIQLANTTGTASVVRSSGNIYSDGTTSYPHTGTAGTYTIGTGGNSNLPNTAFEDMESRIILFASILLVVTGFSLYKLKPYNRN